jgi:uncharacterized linocin/CFP29 family protein
MADSGIGLHRHLAPLSEAAWEAVDEEAREVLRLHLAARRLMEFAGPHGWGYSSIDLGDVTPIEVAIRGASFRRRRVRPLVELRVSFELERAELERIDRGARDADLDSLREAARRFAAAEDIALFQGIEDADLPGLLTDADHEPVALPEDGARIPDVVVEALSRLRRAGVAGPYALALGPEPFAALESTVLEGYPVLRHVQTLIDGPVVWAPPLAGGAVLSLRGGDFRLVVGRDVSIGYLSHDEERVRLYLEESFSAELTGPEAVVPLLRSRGA